MGGESLDGGCCDETSPSLNYLEAELLKGGTKNRRSIYGLVWEKEKTDVEMRQNIVRSRGIHKQEFEKKKME